MTHGALERGRVGERYLLNLCGGDGRNDDQFRVVWVQPGGLELAEFSAARERQEVPVNWERTVSKDLQDEVRAESAYDRACQRVLNVLRLHQRRQ